MSRRLCVLALGVTLVGMLSASTSKAADVFDGWNLFETGDGDATFEFMGLLGLGPVDFDGSPLGSFDFGGGALPTGDTDTIVHRLQTATMASPTIDIELVALELVSSNTVEIGNGPEFLIVTLAADFGDSEMTVSGIDSGPRFFSSTLHFTFNLTGTVSGDLFGGTSGQPPLEKTLSQSSTAWDHTPQGGFTIVGINLMLNGFNNSNDFFPTEVVLEDDGGGTIHAVPTVSEWGMILFSLLLGAAGARHVVRSRYAGAAGPSGVVFAAGHTGLDPELYPRTLLATLVLAGLGLLLARVGIGTLSAVDVVGTLASAVVIAYIAQLWIGLRRR